MQEERDASAYGPKDSAYSGKSIACPVSGTGDQQPWEEQCVEVPGLCAEAFGTVCSQRPPLLFGPGCL